MKPLRSFKALIKLTQESQFKTPARIAPTAGLDVILWLFYYQLSSIEPRLDQMFGQ
jgi:hypothetical protein